MHLMRWRARLLGIYLTSLFLLPRIRSAQVNVTIDDQFGDPTTGQLIQYNPSQAWQKGQECEPCTAKPRPISNAHRGTWMDGGYFPASSQNVVAGQDLTASVPFIGTAVYVQVILTGSEQFPTGNSDMTFLIDNSAVGSFLRAPNGDPSYQFNQTVFAMSGLQNSLHTLTVQLGPSENRSLILLDSIIYTTETSDDSSESDASNSDSESDSSTNTAVIVGPVVGGVIVAAALIALLFFLRRRRQGQRVRVLLDSPPTGSIDPAPGGGTTQRRDVIPGQVDPYMATSQPNYSHANASWVDASSMHENFIPAIVPSQYGPTVSSQYYDTNSPSQGSRSYGSGSRTGESVVSANAPLSPSQQSPPAYSEISHTTPSDAPRMAQTYGKGAVPSR